MYLVKSNILFELAYPRRVWKIDTAGEKQLYLSFDDGPHEKATPFVLDTLKRYHAKATFFCLGKNVLRHPELYQQIIDERHSVGNHSHNHLNGWKTPDKIYLEDIKQASLSIRSSLFRPPYGRMTRSQEKLFLQSNPQNKIIMWKVLSGDFDQQLSPEGCLQNVIKSSSPGAIIVFHDSEKAFGRMQYTLPRILEHYQNKGYQFNAIAMQ